MIKKLLLILVLASIACGALIETDFSEYTTGNALSDWTERWNTGNVSNIVQAGTWGEKIGKELFIDNDATQRQMISWNDLDGTTDCDIITLLTTNQINQGWRINCRASGAVGSQYAYSAVYNTGALRIAMYLNGVSSDIETVGCYLENNNYYWIRFQVIGTALKVKIWSYNEIEPEDWTIEDTDSNISSGGWVGIGGYSIADTYCYYFACDTSGTTAAIPDAYTGCDAFSMLLPNTQNEAFGNATRVMGGLMPSGQSWNLTGAEIYCGTTHNTQVRVAVYSGGTLSDGPDGATLLHDFGETVGAATDNWIELSCDAVEITDNAALWIAVKGNDSGFNIIYSDMFFFGSHGNFQIARGRFMSDTVSTDESVAYPATWPVDGGSFAAYWYAWKILLTAQSPPSTEAQVMIIKGF